MIEPINRELAEHLDRLEAGDFSGVFRIRRKYNRSKATKERLEDLKTRIHDKEYLDKAVGQMASKMAQDYQKSTERGN